MPMDQFRERRLIAPLQKTSKQLTVGLRIITGSGGVAQLADDARQGTATHVASPSISMFPELAWRVDDFVIDSVHPKRDPPHAHPALASPARPPAVRVRRRAEAP